jgi:xanthine/uracil/vitamin C permease (AzgA family)
MELDPGFALAIVLVCAIVFLILAVISRRRP